MLSKHVMMRYLGVILLTVFTFTITRILLKKIKKKSLESFSNEENASLINDIRTILMNSESEWQKNMNEALEKISDLEISMSGINDMSNAQQKTPTETPVQTPVETPVQTLVETPVQTPVETPVQIPVETPVETTAQIPVAPGATSNPPINMINEEENLKNMPDLMVDDENEDESMPGVFRADDTAVGESFVTGITSCVTSKCSMY